jgi:hypothetical protein
MQTAAVRAPRATLLGSDGPASIRNCSPDEPVLNCPTMRSTLRDLRAVCRDNVVRRKTGSMSNFPSEILSSQRIQSMSKESLRNPEDAHPPRVNPRSKSRTAVGKSVERQALAAVS